MAVLYLCRAPKARECDTFKNYLLERRQKGYRPPIPDFALDVHTQRGKHMGRTVIDWWNDDAWMTQNGYGRYVDFAALKKAGGSLPPEGSPE